MDIQVVTDLTERLADMVSALDGLESDSANISSSAEDLAQAISELKEEFANISQIVDGIQLVIQANAKKGA